MSNIHILDPVTIDKIAAGEVVERPASVVKELVENAIDAGASAIKVEIQDGGVSLIRITDNGSGIQKNDIQKAFLRHATSKIQTVDDLENIMSLGFRGEALSSISAVSKVELMTKCAEEPSGIRYLISGGVEEKMEEAGVPQGTTLIIRQLFYNVPARKKFLKTSMTEAGHVSELMTRLALSHPEISFSFVSQNQEKLSTYGNGQLKDVIYQAFGRDVAGGIIPVDLSENGIHVEGYIGKPELSRGNRNYENFFINGRYIKSNIISKAVEDGFSGYTMQHRFPFAILNIEMESASTDVNVHPAKLEVRFKNQQAIYNTVYNSVKDTLGGQTLIPDLTLEVKSESAVPPVSNQSPALEQAQGLVQPPSHKADAEKPGDLDYFMDKMRERVQSYHCVNGKTNESEEKHEPEKQNKSESIENVEKSQISLFNQEAYKASPVKDYCLIGQAFDTYWFVQHKDSLLIVDQHAAHEKVLYERTIRSLKTRQYTSQNINPPIVLNLSMREAELLQKNMDRFTEIGFEIQDFGEDAFLVRAVPDNLFSIAKKELLFEMMDHLSDEIDRKMTEDLINEKIASMSCKAAVKGKMKMTFEEMDILMGELLKCENPFHCPHGRPVLISMTKRELEKKFKRII